MELPEQSGRSTGATAPSISGMSEGWWAVPHWVFYTQGQAIDKGHNHGDGEERCSRAWGVRRWRRLGDGRFLRGPTRSGTATPTAAHTSALTWNVAVHLLTFAHEIRANIDMSGVRHRLSRDVPDRRPHIVRLRREGFRHVTISDELRPELGGSERDGRGGDEAVPIARHRPHHEGLVGDRSEETIRGVRGVAV